MEYYPIGTSWEEAFVDCWENQGLYDSFYRVKSMVVGDTLIAGVGYKTIERQITECTYDPSIVGDKDYQFIREENNCIFFLDGDGGYEETKPIYDFNWENLGNEFFCQNWAFHTDKFDMIEEVLLDGNTYDCLFLDDSFSYKIYRNIGQIIGGLIKRSCNYGARTTMRLRLTSFTRNDVQIYQFNIPTPSPSGILYIQTEGSPFLTEFFTLQGVKVNKSSLPSGIYIQNGKKYVK